MKTKKLVPQFTVGQRVRFKKPDLMGCTEGKIMEIEKVYQAMNEDGTFDMHGLATLHSTIEAIKIPHKLEGDILTVTYPSSGRTQVSKFHHYAYTVDSGKMLTTFPSRFLTSI